MLANNSLQTPATRWGRRSGVRASAGSGKTYELTGHYIRALLLGARPAEMLATTFTRKAAGEILERVLLRLAGACADPQKLEALRRDMDMPELELGRVRQVLRQLTRELHRVSIATLDSFFGRLLRCYRHELDVPAQVRTLDQNAPEVLQLRREAVRRLLERGDTEHILGLLDRLHKGLARRSVAESLLEQFASAHELYQNSGPEQWEPDYAVGQRLPAAEVQRLTAALRAVAERTPGRPGTAALKDAAKLPGDCAGFIAGGLAAKVASGDCTYYSKPLPEELVACYEPLVQHARADALARHVEYVQALRDLLALYDEEYTALCREKQILVFADVPLLLSRLVATESAGELAHRLDADLTHMLLDEFQDTDPRQYAILKPLAEAIHAGPAGSGLLFCVGDLKQSIYGWRGATPEIFEQIGADLPQLEWSSKNESFRSSQMVLDAVNDLYGTLDANALLLEKAPAAASAWHATFGDHIAKRELTGYVEVVESDAPESDAESEEGETPDAESTTTPADAHMQFCAVKIQELAQATPLATIGVLVRSNAAAFGLITALKRLGVAASAEGGGSLVDHPAIELALAALRLADHPSDSAAAFALFHSPLWPLLQTGAHTGRATPPGPGTCCLLSYKLRRDLLELGYAAVVARWGEALAPHCDERGRTRLQQLLGLAEEFDLQPGARPGEFQQMVLQRTVEEPSGDRVRVMTIHKSKGLEFDVVVLPQLHAELKSRGGLIHSRDKNGRIERITSSPNSSLRQLEPALSEIYEGAASREMRESLCLLYVAMTRARRALHIVLPQPKLKTDGTPRKTFSLGAIVRSGLQGLRRGGGSTIYCHGDPYWYEDEAHSVGAEPAPPAHGVPGHGVPATAPPLGGPDWAAPAIWDMSPRGLVEVRPSEGEVSGPRSARHLLGVPDNDQREAARIAARRRGTGVHAMLRMVQWAGDPLPPESELREKVRRDCPTATNAEIAQWRAEFEVLLQRPTVAAYLAPPPGREGVDFAVWVEQAFEVVLGGKLVKGRFDRVLLQLQDGRPVSAEILDWKTDAEVSSAASQRYHFQMNQYRAVLRQMLGLQQVTARLVYVETGGSVLVGEASGE